MFGAYKPVVKTRGFLFGQLQRPQRARSKCEGWNWNKRLSDDASELPEPCRLFPAKFYEFVFEQARFADALDGAFKCPLLAFSCLHSPRNIVTKMAFEFVQDFWILYAGGAHLLPPVRDGLFEIKHVVLSIDR